MILPTTQRIEYRTRTYRTYCTIDERYTTMTDIMFFHPITNDMVYISALRQDMKFNLYINNLPCTKRAFLKFNIDDHNLEAKYTKQESYNPDTKKTHYNIMTAFLIDITSRTNDHYGILLHLSNEGNTVHVINRQTYHAHTYLIESTNQNDRILERKM